MTLILASQSAARRALLSAAGVDFEAMPPMVDEDAAKAGFRARGLDARDLADALAELKALRVSLRHIGRLVLGADQTLALDDGTMFDKATSPAELRAQLAALSGQTHSLYSAAVIAQAGQPLWRHIERVKLTMRPLSSDFLDDYVSNEGISVMSAVGGYHIEGRGATLFSRIDGSHFAILGLPLLPLLAHLRTIGLMPV
ncbi:MAG: Maf family protein [Sphingomonadaceae bacterium]